MEIFFQLLLSVFLGGLLGLEREYKRKEAGLRTYILVSLGSAFFTIIGNETIFLFSLKMPGINPDPTRIVSQIVLGIGFLGAGLIVFRGSHIEGLTTAAGIWIAAAVGVAVGIKLYLPAVFVTFLTIGILAGLKLLEKRMFNKNL